jgi:hypothetical protein
MFKMQPGVPMPRIRGNAYQRVDKTWGWELVVTVGDQPIEDGVCLGHPEDKPGFLTKDIAIQSMKDFIPGVIDTLSKEVYGVDKPDGYLDLKSNTFKEKL